MPVTVKNAERANNSTSKARATYESGKSIHKLGGSHYAVFKGTSLDFEVVSTKPAIHNIFNVSLYDAIAADMLKHERTYFDKSVGKYHIYIEYDYRFGGYFDGCADIEDDWAEIATNFDGYELEAAIARHNEYLRKTA